MIKLDDLFEKYGICLKNYNIDELLNKFIKEMNLGLENKDSSLAMINSYITPSLNWENETVAVIDAGGTNLRIGLAALDREGKINLYNFIKTEMPGREEEIEPNEFYDLISKNLYNFKNDFSKIGFCFSYPTKIFPNKDGKLLYWTKEIKIPRMAGQFIGKNLLSSLSENNIDEKKITILNDTVATLLSGYTVGIKKNISKYTGFILGTGTNSSCIINNSIYNIESGGFAHFPFSKLDDELDKKSENTGQYRFEKAISGAYLGCLSLIFMQKIANDGLFSDSANLALSIMHHLETSQLSELYDDNINKNNIFYSQAFNQEDRKIIKLIFDKIIERAALFSAINIAATIIKSNQNDNSKVLITADGSTLYKTPNLFKNIETNLDRLLIDKEISYEFVEVENAPLVGAAIAAISL